MQYPVSDIYDPERSSKAAASVLGVALPLLAAVKRHGLDALARCSGEPGGEHVLALIVAYRHLLEMLDGLEILLAQVAPAPARLQIRAIFEAMLTIEYILQAGSDAERTARCYDYLVSNSHDRLRALKMVDADTDIGKRTRERAEKDTHGKGFPTPSEDVLSQHRKQRELIEGHLSDIPGWKEAEQRRSELTASLKKRGRRHAIPNWYSVAEGPRHLSALAEHLNRPYLYDLLYHQWSRTAHAVDFSALVPSAQGTTTELLSLREPRELASIANFAVAFTLTTSRHMLEFFRPTENAYRSWYEREVRPLWLRLPCEATASFSSLGGLGIEFKP